MLYRKKDYLYQWEVQWKRPTKFLVDVFDYLKDFCTKHSAYNEDELLHLMKAKKGYRYEDENLILTRIPFQYKGIVGERLNVRDNFFWEFDIPEMRWNQDYGCLIERVLSRGRPVDFEELIRFYGRDTVVNVFRNQSRSFWAEMEEDARLYFGLEKEDLLIYHIRKQHNFWSPWNRKVV